MTSEHFLQHYIFVNVNEKYKLLVHCLFQAKFGSNMDKSKCWNKNVIKKYTVKK